MHKAMTDRLSWCKQNNEGFVLDEARQGATKGWQGGSKTKLRKNFGGWL